MTTARASGPEIAPGGGGSDLRHRIKRADRLLGNAHPRRHAEERLRIAQGGWSARLGRTTGRARTEVRTPEPQVDQVSLKVDTAPMASPARRLAT